MSQPVINAALCSFGMSGKLFHGPFIHAHPGFHLYAVWERSRKTAHEVYPGIRSYPTYDELLTDPVIGLIVVNTPNATHFEYCRQALEAGKHVVVEKPFVLSIDEGLTLDRLAKGVGKKLAVYQNRRWDTDFLSVQKILTEQRLGKLVEVEVHYDRFRPQLSPKVHKEGQVPGSGLLWDLGPHLLDQALALFGKPSSIYADLAIMRPSGQVTDFFELLLFYPGMRVRLRASNLVRMSVPGYVLHGTMGSFVKNRADVQERDLLTGKSPTSPDWGLEDEHEQGILTTDADGKTLTEVIPSAPSNYLGFYEAVWQSIVTGGPEPVTALQALENIRLILAAIESNEQRRVLEVV